VQQPRRFGGGPEADDLRRWVREGLTDQQIGELVGQLENQEPASKQAVAYWRKKYGITRDRKRAESLDHSAVRPWRVKMEHTGDGIEHRLYDYSRRRQGQQLTPAAERLLDDFLEFLAEHQWVVDYNPDTANGYLFRHRDPDIDDPDNIVRHPDRPGVLASR
jgi:hypothetical protein